VDCFGPTEAIETAVVTALNHMNESHALSRWAGWSVEIETGTGERVATVPFALAWRMHGGRNFR